MAVDEVVWCEVCDAFSAESRIDVLRHLKEDHTLSQRLEALMYEGQPSDEMAADGGQSADDVERFEEHPNPDRFFMEIEPAEVEMEVFDHDEVTFKSQHVPGGSFGLELSARYSYAGRDCTQIISLDRDAAESLHERLNEVLEVDDRE